MTTLSVISRVSAERIELRLAQGAVDVVEQARMLELSCREVHGQADRGRRELARPGGRLAAGFLEHPLADRDDQARLLGGRDEVIRAGSSPRTGCSQRTRASTSTMSRASTSDTIGW